MCNLTVCGGRSHWTLAVINLGRRRIEYYDSLYGGDTRQFGQRCGEHLRLWMAAESQDKRQCTFDWTGWDDDVHIPQKIPQQKNGYDCGMFMLLFARHLCAGVCLESLPFDQRIILTERQRLVLTLTQWSPGGNMICFDVDDDDSEVEDGLEDVDNKEVPAKRPRTRPESSERKEQLLHSDFDGLELNLGFGICDSSDMTRPPSPNPYHVPHGAANLCMPCTPERHCDPDGNDAILCTPQKQCDPDQNPIFSELGEVKFDLEPLFTMERDEL